MASLSEEDADTAVMTKVKTELPDDDGENRSAAAAAEKTSDDEDNHMRQDAETSDKMNPGTDSLADDVALNAIKQEKKTEVILDLSRVPIDDDDDDDDDDSADGIRYLSFPFSLSSTSSFIVVTELTFLQRVSIACYADTVLAIVNPSVRPSVCLSVTRWHCVSMTLATIMGSSLANNPMTSFLVVNFSAKFQRKHKERGRRMREG